MHAPRADPYLSASWIAWAALVLATGLGLWLGHGSRSCGSAAESAVAGVILLAVLKVWIVGFQFMELRHAPRWLRHLFDAWLAGVGALLLVILLR